VQNKVGITFRLGAAPHPAQDPDIIMVGEIRDAETAQYAIQAALTGHLVFSTLHTNDAPRRSRASPTSVVERFMITSTLAGSHGAASAAQDLPALRARSATSSATRPRRCGCRSRRQARQGQGRQGLPQCRGTGYLGRTGIFEVLSWTTRSRS
jgi:general secretion pathway protein E